MRPLFYVFFWLLIYSTKSYTVGKMFLLVAIRGPYMRISFPPSRKGKLVDLFWYSDLSESVNTSDLVAMLEKDYGENDTTPHEQDAYYKKVGSWEIVVLKDTSVSWYYDPAMAERGASIK